MNNLTTAQQKALQILKDGEWHDCKEKFLRWQTIEILINKGLVISKVDMVRDYPRESYKLK